MIGTCYVPKVIEPQKVVHASAGSRLTQSNFGVVRILCRQHLFFTNASRAGGWANYPAEMLANESFFARFAE